jgi:hypothetical protein
VGAHLEIKMAVVDAGEMALLMQRESCTNGDRSATEGHARCTKRAKNNRAKMLFVLKKWAFCLKVPMI